MAQGSVPLLRTTAVHFLANGTVAAGSTAQIRVRGAVGGVTHDPLAGGGAVEAADHPNGREPGRGPDPDNDGGRRDAPSGLRFHAVARC